MPVLSDPDSPILVTWQTSPATRQLVLTKHPRVTLIATPSSERLHRSTPFLELRRCLMGRIHPPHNGLPVVPGHSERQEGLGLGRSLNSGHGRFRDGLRIDLSRRP